MIFVAAATLFFMLWFITDCWIDEQLFLERVIYPLLVPFMLLWELLVPIFKCAATILDVLLCTLYLLYSGLSSVCRQLERKCSLFDEWLALKCDGQLFV